MAEQNVVVVPWGEASQGQVDGSSDPYFVAQLATVVQMQEWAIEARNRAEASVNVADLRRSVIQLSDTVFHLSREVEQLLRGLKSARVIVAPDDPAEVAAAGSSGA